MSVAMEQDRTVIINGDAVNAIVEKVADRLKIENIAVQATILNAVYDGLVEAHRIQNEIGDPMADLKEFAPLDEGNIEKYLAAMDADLERILKEGK